MRNQDIYQVKISLIFKSVVYINIVKGLVNWLTKKKNGYTCIRNIGIFFCQKLALWGSFKRNLLVGQIYRVLCLLNWSVASMMSSFTVRLSFGQNPLFFMTRLTLFVSKSFLHARW